MSCFECDMEKYLHTKDNEMFLNLLRMIWEDQGAIAHMSEETYWELHKYAESWGWMKKKERDERPT